MEDVTRKRLMRLLDRLPEEQLYQVLDYIEFLEMKYARETARKPDAFQEFAERVEDQLRVRSLAPKAMKGTLRLMSTAGRVLDGVRDLGKGLTEPSGNGPGARDARDARASRGATTGRAGAAGADTESGAERAGARDREDASGDG